MNRIFHVRVVWYQYFLLLILTANCVFSFWCRYALVGFLTMLLLIVVIEQIIHSSYTVTADGQLIVSSGRFIPKRTVPLKEITSVELHRSAMLFGSFSLTRYVLIEYGKGKFVSAVPVREEEFIALLRQRMERQ